MGSRDKSGKLEKDRMERIKQIVNERMRGQNDGSEATTDETIIKSNPDLMPELANSLRNARRAQETCDHDGNEGPIGLRARCPDCQHIIEITDDAELSAVACSSCGSNFSLVDERLLSFQADELESVGHFKLLDKLGAGAFGSVWSARDTTLERLVAVKIPRKGQLSAEDTEQFIREARTAAQLNHPNIVRVHEVGREDDRVYIVTDIVQGVDLAKWLTDRQSSPREATELVASVADALQHAHERGIVHRDLKPSNIMLDTEGKPHLMDFGLAKRDAGEMTMTADGKLLGTPAYMSPEQARGAAHQTDARSDIYSLGVIFFELLTGERPFRGNLRMLLHQVLVEDAPSPRKLNSNIPKDLETICLKCLEKDPNRRYQTALNLSEDLRRFLRGEPVQARRIPQVARAWRWCRRNRTVASLIALVAAMLIIGAIVSTGFAFRFRHLANVASDAQVREEDAKRDAQSVVTDTYTSLGLVAGDRGDDAQAALWFANAASRAPIPEQEQPNRLRVAAWSQQLPMPIHAFMHEGQWPTKISFHPSGAYLFVLSMEGNLTIWDLTTGNHVDFVDRYVSSASWSPEGRLIAIGLQDKAEIWTFPSRQRIETIEHSGTISALAFNDDAKLLAIASQTLRAWNVGEREFVAPEFVHPKPVVKVTFDRQGKKLATGCDDGMARLFTVGQETDGGDAMENSFVSLDSPDGRIPVGPVFVDGGRGLLTLTDYDQVSLWDTTSGELKDQVKGVAGVFHMRPSPDHRYFVIGGFQKAQLCSAQGATIGVMRHLNNVYAADFSTDGQTLLTVSADRTARLWSLRSLPDVIPLTSHLRHQEEIRLAAFSPDGQTFATAQSDGLVRIWRFPNMNPNVHAIKLGTRESFVRLSLDGQFLIPAAWNQRRDLKTAQVYSVASGQPDGRPLGLNEQLNSAAFSPDGNTVVTLSSLRDKPGHAIFWKWRTGERLFEPLVTPSEPIAVDYSPDGKLAIVVCRQGEILVIDTNSSAVLDPQLDHPPPARHAYVIRDWVKFAPNGEFFATWGMGNTVRVWRTEDRSLQHELRHDQGEEYTFCHDVCFFQDSTMIVTASSDKTVRIWNIETGQPVVDPLQHPDWVFSARLSPNEQHVLTACRDHMARLWDWRSGTLVCPTLPHENEVFGVDFSPNGRFLLTSGKDKKARIWERRTGKPLTKRLELPGEGYQVTVTVDGKFAVVAGHMEDVQVFDMESFFQSHAGRELDAIGLVVLSEILSGQQLHKRGGVVNQTTGQWLKKWHDFNLTYPGFFEPEPSN